MESVPYRLRYVMPTKARDRSEPGQLPGFARIKKKNEPPNDWKAHSAGRSFLHATLLLGVWRTLRA